MNYYVYQYATGFAAATTLADQISTNQPGALDNYLDLPQKRVPVTQLKRCKSRCGYDERRLS